MGFLDDLKKQPGAAEAQKPADKGVFKGKEPAQDQRSETKRVDTTALGQKVVRAAEKTKDPLAMAEAMIAAPEENILSQLNPPANSLTGAKVPDNSIDIQISSETSAPAPKPDGTASAAFDLGSLMAMDPSELVQLAIGECKKRGISDEDSLMDAALSDSSLRPFIKAFGKRMIPLEDIFNIAALPAPGSHESPESRPKTRLDSPAAIEKPKAPGNVSIAIAGEEDVDPCSGTVLQPSGQAPAQGANPSMPVAPMNKDQPQPITGTNPPQKAPKSVPPPLPKKKPAPDPLGIHAFMEKTERDPSLNAAQKVEAALAQFQENPKIVEFMAAHKDGFLKILEGAKAKLDAGQPLGPDDMKARDIDALHNFMKRKQKRADDYQDVREDIKARQTGGTSSAPVPVKLQGDKGKTQESGPFMRFLTSPTTLSVFGAAAFGGVLYSFGYFEDISLGLNKAFEHLGRVGPNVSKQIVMVAYASITSLSVLVSELFRRFRVDREVKMYIAVEKLPEDLQATYKLVRGKLEEIARHNAKRDDQSMALKEALKNESFFLAMEKLRRKDSGKPLIAAIKESGLNSNVYDVLTLDMAEIKIMEVKFGKIAAYLRDSEPRHGLFRSMFAQDELFRMECQKLLATDSKGKLVCELTLQSICKRIKPKNGEDITAELMQVLRNEFDNVDSQYTI